MRSRVSWLRTALSSDWCRVRIRNEHWAGRLASNLFCHAARSGRADDDQVRVQLASTPQGKPCSISAERLVLSADSSLAQASGEFGNCDRRIKPVPGNELARVRAGA
jgi:hypothetical protein